MSTISENLLALAQCKADIRQAIIDKGVDVPANTPFADYATKVSSISGGGVQLPQNVFCSSILGTEVTSEE